MKKVFVVALTLAILTGIAVAQYSSGGDMSKDSSASAPLKNIKGTVKTDAGKTWFVADKDSKSWKSSIPRRRRDTKGTTCR